jgi:hypothetical protein
MVFFPPSPTWRPMAITTAPGPAQVDSAKAAGDTTHITALGVILNSNGSGAIYSSGAFDGVTSTPATDVLVKYTYYGDTNLDGKIDGSDYGRVDFAYLNNQNTNNARLTGWYNGDFNYDGYINGSDYTLMDDAYNTQRARLSDEIAGIDAQNTSLFAGNAAGAATSNSAVPEPSTIGLVSVAAASILLGRRRTSCFKL